MCGTLTPVVHPLAHRALQVAWYLHLKFKSWPLVKAIFLSWLIAFFEYCLQVPANRCGRCQPAGCGQHMHAASVVCAPASAERFLRSIGDRAVLLRVLCMQDRPFHWRRPFHSTPAQDGAGVPQVGKGGRRTAACLSLHPMPASAALPGRRLLLPACSSLRAPQPALAALVMEQRLPTAFPALAASPPSPSFQSRVSEHPHACLGCVLQIRFAGVSLAHLAGSPSGQVLLLLCRPARPAVHARGAAEPRSAHLSCLTLAVCPSTEIARLTLAPSSCPPLAPSAQGEAALV